MAFQGRNFAIAAVALVGGLGLSGCATTEYVDEQIATVNARISALESQVQQVNQTAQAAAAEAQNANQRIDALTGRVDAIEQSLAQRRPRN